MKRFTCVGSFQGLGPELWSATVFAAFLYYRNISYFPFTITATSCLDTLKAEIVTSSEASDQTFQHKPCMNQQAVI